MADTAFVFVYLPGERHPVVAGRFTLSAEAPVPAGEFVYGKSFLSNRAALTLDPVALPLKEQLFQTTLSSGFFGVIRDAIPDDWGRHVAQKLYGDKYARLFDYLWLPAADRMGALAFGRTAAGAEAERPLLEWSDIEGSVYLEALQKLDRNDPLTEAEEQVAPIFGGGTAGGARPKFTVRWKNAVWLAKLNRQSDRFNEVRVEAAMLDLAAACAIEVPVHEVMHLHNQDVLLVQRFDRTVTDAGILRHRMVSAATVFQADETLAHYAFTGSYPRLARELGRWTVNGKGDRPQLFRRMVFNALTSNTDDHERNHALIAAGDHFRLSPAFDLSPKPSATDRRYQALSIGEYGAIAVRANVLSRAELFNLTAQAAYDIVDEVQQTIRMNWRAFMQSREVTPTDLDKVARCFDPPSFEAAPPDNPRL